MSMAWIFVVVLSYVCFVLLMALIFGNKENKLLRLRLKDAEEENKTDRLEFIDERYKLKGQIDNLNIIKSRLERENSELKQVLFDVRETIRSSSYEQNG